MTTEQTAAIERWNKRNITVAREKIAELLAEGQITKIKTHPLLDYNTVICCAEVINTRSKELESILLPIFTAAEERRFFANIAMKEMLEGQQELKKDLSQEGMVYKVGVGWVKQTDTLPTGMFHTG